MKYRKKPVVIEAIQWTCNNLNEVMDFIGSEFKYDPNTTYVTSKFIFCKDSKKLQINTLEGTMLVSKGDYIIKGVKGEFYPCKPDIFNTTYEIVTEEIFIKKTPEDFINSFIETMNKPGMIIVDRPSKETPHKVLLEADGYADGELVYDTAVCPNCGRNFEIDYDEHCNYCPNCGQHLDWSEVDENNN